MECLNICAPGPIDWYDSYGLLAAQLARHMTRMGVYVNLFALGGRQCDNQPDDVKAVIEQPVRAACGAIYLGYPTSFATHQNPLLEYGPRIAITMFESSKPPASWRPILNTMDAVIVPSQFCWRIFRDSGVTAPIYVVPLGINDAYRNVDGGRERPMWQPFTFLAFLDRGRRKGGQIAEQAFVRAFGNDPNYRLILKMREPKIRIAYTNPNIYLIQRDMTDEELCQLYLSTDAMVFASHGEGWGMPPRDYAATGGITLATGWSGLADDQPLWSIALPYTLGPADWSGAKNLEGQDLGDWAWPDVERIAAILRHVADHRAVYEDFARSAQSVVRSLYSWQEFAESVLDIWKGVTGAHTGQSRVSTLHAIAV
jgi:glycosyltransferase involved in cell wall biosynthesis